MPACPLCLTPARGEALSIRTGSYHWCDACDLVFRDQREWLDAAAEHAYYMTHENRVDDPGYRRFLSQLAEPLIERLRPGEEGLDYGAGAAPALALMLTERGFPTLVFDPFFAPDEDGLQRKHDFITCTEVLEHMHHPGAELARLDSLLKPGGRLAVMTELRPDRDRFPEWHYHRDPTHVCFYSVATMHWIANRYQWSAEIIGSRVVMFTKPRRP